MKQLIPIILSIFTIILSVADGFAQSTRVYRVTFAEGPVTPYFLTEYVTCEDETDNCYIYYLFGKSPYSGERLEVRYEISEVEEFSDLSSYQESVVKRQFRNICGDDVLENYSCTYATNSSGSRELYIVNFALPNAWLFYRGKLADCYWLHEEE